MFGNPATQPTEHCFLNHHTMAKFRVGNYSSRNAMRNDETLN
jgi:hypothetical protein